MQPRLVPVGRFFFRHRNWAFPALVGGFFAAAIPPSTLFGSEALEDVKDAIAVLIALSGLTLRALVIGRDHVRRSGQGRSVHASHLITTGMFALCRNPLYTGNILIFLGIFLMHGNPWTLVLGWSSYILIYAAIVAAEEDYLRRTFGPAYDQYCAAVPRWLPDIRRLGEAAGDRPFNARRVLLVEYPTIGIVAIALALAEFYEEVAEPLTETSGRRLAVLALVMAASAAWVGVVRFLKKRSIIVAG